MNLADASTSRPMGTTINPLPSDLPWPDRVPEHSLLRGREHWLDWTVASVRRPDGFDPQTGKQLFRTTELVTAPYPEFRAVVRMPRITAFRDVVAAARYLAVDGVRDAKDGEAHAVMQSETGTWYIAMLGTADRGGHIEPTGLGRPGDAVVTRRMRDVVALVGSKSWVNFSQHRL